MKVTKRFRIVGARRDPKIDRLFQAADLGIEGVIEPISEIAVLSGDEEQSSEWGDALKLAYEQSGGFDIIVTELRTK